MSQKMNIHRKATCPILGWQELTNDEKAYFDYINESGDTDHLQFVRYNGSIYDLGEFTVSHSLMGEWDCFFAETWFSGLVAKTSRDEKTVTMAMYYT